MSKLKVYEDLDDYIGYDDTPPMMYDKSEADKVIARNKYKRCLAMAQECEEAYNRECGLNPEEMTNKEFYRQQIEFWPRWSSKWLELADKFKEAK